MPLDPLEQTERNALGQLNQGWPAGQPPGAELAELDDAEVSAFLDRELIEAAREDIDAFITAVMRDEKTGIPLEQAPVHVAWHALAEDNDRMLIWSAIEHGKTTQLSIARTLFSL